MVDQPKEPPPVSAPVNFSYSNGRCYGMKPEEARALGIQVPNRHDRRTEAAVAKREQFKVRQLTAKKALRVLLKKKRDALLIELVIKEKGRWGNLARALESSMPSLMIDRGSFQEYSADDVTITIDGEQVKP